jgi:hypothetical protein
MMKLPWLLHRQPGTAAEAEEVIDLEDFLRSVRLAADNDGAPAGEPVYSKPPRGQRTPAPRERGERSPAPSRVVPPGSPPLQLDERLDEALWETFPASDPIAVSTVA